MRGSPIVRAAVALLILLALGLPLHRLLQAGEQARTAPRVEAPRPVHLQVSFTVPPKQFRVLWLGMQVWQESMPGAELEHDLTLAYPKEGIDLQFELEWPEEPSNAARVRLTDPEGREHVSFIWGQGTATEVLTFP